jgi:hypothetical protein
LNLLYAHSRFDGVLNMTDTKPPLPDRLCIDPKSPHFNKDVLQHQVGIRFNGAEKTNVEEYCISENWVRVPAGGRSKDRYGNPMTVKITGKVEAFYVEE